MTTSSDRDSTVDSVPSDAPLPCVLDIEASGFGSESYPIEVGFVLPDGATWCTLIVPAVGWTHWDDAAEQLHGISRAILQRHGRAAHDVAVELNRQLAGRTVYCDNWAHDYAWLARLFEAAGISPDFKLCHLRELLSESAVARFDAAREAVAQQLKPRRHRASSDAKVLQLSVAKVWSSGARALDPPQG